MHIRASAETPRILLIEVSIHRFGRLFDLNGHKPEKCWCLFKLIQPREQCAADLIQLAVNDRSVVLALHQTTIIDQVEECVPGPRAGATKETLTRQE